MIKLYGSPRSSAGRCFLVLEELGLKYDVVSLDMMTKREHKSAEFQKLNPNGKVPCLTDGEFVIWESLAINHYLVDKYRPALLGSSAEERGLAQQWTLWAFTELQPPMVDLIIQTMFTPEEKRDPGLIAKAHEKIPPLLKILDHALAKSAFLTGSAMTLADLNVASVVNITATLKIATLDFPNLNRWFEKMKALPSFQKVAALRG